MNAVIVQQSLYIFLLLRLIIGLFSVSAGAYLIINNKHINDIETIKYTGISIYFINIGVPKNINNEENQQCQDLSACTPNPVVLNKL